MTPTVEPIYWILFLAFIGFLLFLDLFVFHRKAHVVHIREAAIFSAFGLYRGLWRFASVVDLQLARERVRLYAEVGSARKHLKILTGAVRPDTGTILVRGVPYVAHSPAEARRGGVVSVYQEPALVPDLDVTSNLRLTRTPIDPFRSWLTELGIPRLDLAATARDLRAIARSHGLPERVVVQPLVAGHGEAFIGLQARTDLGPVVLFGRGGVLVEVAPRVGGRTRRPAPARPR